MVGLVACRSNFQLIFSYFCAYDFLSGIGHIGGIEGIVA